MVSDSRKTKWIRVHKDFFKITQDVKKECGFKYNSQATKMLAVYFNATLQKRKKNKKRNSSRSLIKRSDFNLK